MGNSPSTSKPATPTPPNVAGAAGAGAGTGPPNQQYRAGPSHDASSLSPRPSKKEPKNLISAQLHQHRATASSPEASVVTARGSTVARNPNATPLSILNSSSPSASSENSTARSSVSKPRFSEDKNEPSKPVAVPAATHHENVGVHSPQFDDPSLTSNLASNSITDMSYMARPPRLPLPIEEEVHTPGSPIIAPADIGEPVDSVEGLDEQGLTGLPRRASALSNGTDEDDAEELRVDKSRPTVPTRIEWWQGGQKVYVTGTPFNWSRKQRLLPA
jgi:hypothetical protein